MTKDELERLADEIDRHSRKLMVPTGDTPALMHQAAVHLRRLAQVEAEHAALLKAISDAEPVAWIDIEGTSNIVSAPRLYSDGSSSEASLYTLNGIKK